MIFIIDPKNPVMNFFWKVYDFFHHYDHEMNTKIREFWFLNNDFKWQSGAINHLCHLNKHCKWMKKDEKWENIKSLWEINLMSPKEFEHFCAEIIKQKWWLIEECGWMKDGGMDLKGIKKDENGKTEYLAVQCKKWKLSKKYHINLWEINKFYGSENIVKAKQKWAQLLFVTTSYFNPSAKEFAEKHNIEIVDYLDVIRAYKWYKK